MNRIRGLDTLRGLTALSIAVFHTVILLKLIPYGDLPTFVRRLFIAVPLFFALSAFALSLVYFDKLATRGNIITFFVRRVQRIVPLFYLMIALWIWHRGWPDSLTLILNLSFGFTLVPGFNASLVPAGWSIGVEMAFYALFPLVLASGRTMRGALIWLAASLVLALGVGITAKTFAWPGDFDWLSPPVQLPFFVAGMVCFHLYERLKALPASRRKLIALSILAAVPVAIWSLSFAGAFTLSIRGFDLSRHMIGMLLVPLLLGFGLYDFRPLVSRVGAFIGTVSYGIYLIHPWLIAVMGAPLKAQLLAAGAPPPLTAGVVALAVLSGSVLLASISYFGMERPINNWRPKLSRSPVRKMVSARVGATDA